jgi:hypothetical protein
MEWMRRKWLNWMIIVCCDLISRCLGMSCMISSMVSSLRELMVSNLLVRNSTWIMTLSWNLSWISNVFSNSSLSRNVLLSWGSVSCRSNVMSWLCVNNNYWCSNVRMRSVVSKWRWWYSRHSLVVIVIVNLLLSWRIVWVQMLMLQVDLVSKRKYLLCSSRCHF